MATEVNNKRIAKNTLYVYIRLFVSMIVGLYSSRIVLQCLGASDYGLYNVVGSIVAMFSFISGSLATTTTRFINYEFGKKEGGNVNKVFNASRIIHIIFALLIFILAEIIGCIYVNNYLNIDPAKLGDAMFVFQVSIIVTCIGLINIPYQSLFIATEKFDFITIVDIFVILVKLCLVFCLLIYEGNLLRMYALGMSGFTFLKFAIYHYQSFRTWPNYVKWSRVRNYFEYKQILFFNNYNLLATVSIIARSQGSNILINMFFGTTVNAAYAISNTIQQYVNTFIGNFDAASSPQITQNISSGDIESASYLVRKTCRICILLLVLVYFPLVTEMDYVLCFWLGNNVPDGTSLLCKYTLLIAVASATSGGLTHMINGCGKIKWFKIQVSILALSCIVFGYLSFKNGLPAYTIILLFAITDMISRVIQLYLLRRLIGFDVKRFLKEAYSAPLYIFVIMIIYQFVYNHYMLSDYISNVGGICLTLMLSILLVWFIGLNVNERRMIWNKIVRHCF